LVWFGFGLASYDLGFLTTAAAGEFGFDGEQIWIEVCVFEIEAIGYVVRRWLDRRKETVWCNLIANKRC